MASETGRASLNLRLDLLKEGHRFSFFQVMRLFRLFDAYSNKLTGLKPIEAIKLKARPDLTLLFPASDIAGIEEVSKEDLFYRVTVTFLGLYGISSPLPTFYTEDLFREEGDDKSVMRDFLDIFNHRLYLLFFRCLLKYRYFLKVVEEKDPQFFEILFSLIGLGEKELREDVPDTFSLFRYIGLFTQFPRSALGLKTMLSDTFKDFPVQIIPCMMKRVKIPEDQRMLLGVQGAYIGVDSFLGEEIEDRMGSFRLLLGPLNNEQFHALLPDTEGFRRLNALTGFYLTDPLEYDIEIILRSDELKTVGLGVPDWSRLGYDTWIFSGKYDGDVRTCYDS